MRKNLATLVLLFILGCTSEKAFGLTGSGTAVDPYQISSLTDLRFLSENSGYWASGVYFIQTADIDASTTSTWNSGAGFSPIGNGTTIFAGNYNGQNHTISGLYINLNSSAFIGVFGKSSGTVQNLGIINSEIHGQNQVGGIVGYNTGTVSQCFNYNTSIQATTGHAGGVVGYSAGTISKCYSTGSVSGGRAGGLLVPYLLF
jgi:hypothetical protein